MRISQSEIATFLDCRRQWLYSSENQMNLEPKQAALPLWFGTGVHYALETFYARPDADPAVVPADVFLAWAVENSSDERERDDDERLRWAETVGLGVAMLEGYVQRYGQRPNDDADGIRVLVSEQEFRVPIPETEDGWFVGRADGLLRDSTGSLWLLEHKTYTPAPRTDLLQLNPQILSYTWAFQMLSDFGALAPYGVRTGERIEGALYNGLRKQRPGPRVSVALFNREWVFHTRDELVDIQERLAAIHETMVDSDLPLYPSPGKACDMCAFRTPCVATQLAQDADWHLRNDYVVRKPRGSVYAQSVLEASGLVGGLVVTPTEKGEPNGNE